MPVNRLNNGGSVRIGGGSGQQSQNNGAGTGGPRLGAQQANNARVFSAGNQMQEAQAQTNQFEQQARGIGGREVVQQVIDVSRFKGAVAGVGINLANPEPAVNTPAGQSLLEYDGMPYEAHKRSVSINKPEVLGRFTFRPAFQTSGQAGVSLTSEGAFLDVQINARKIRINDIQTLFDEMSADPESPTGVLAANLVEELEANLKQAEGSFDKLVDITSRINQFIGTLKIRSVQPKMQDRMQELRNTRLDDHEFLPDTLEKKQDFRGMMVNNHHFTEEQVDEFSATKLMYYLGYDIKNCLIGPSFTGAGITQLRAARGRTPGGLDEFRAIHQGEGQSSYPFFAAAEMNLLAPFNTGICSSNSLEVASSPNRIRSAGAEPPQLISTPRPPDSRTLFQNEENTAEACNLLLSAISRNLAQSSAIGNNEFMAAFKEEFGTQKTNIADALFASLPLPGTPGPSPISVSADKSFVKTMVYSQGPDGFTEILRPFDPDLPALLRSISEDGDSPGNATNTVFKKLIEPILETTTEGAPDASALTRYTTEVSTKLRKVASSIEYILAANNETLDPLSILNKVLLNFKNRLDDLNLQESNDGFISTYFVDFCLLSEAYHDTGRDGEVEERAFPVNNRRPRTVRAKYYPFNSLITTFLVCLGKQRDTVEDNFFDLVVDADEDPLSKSELEGMARLLAKHARFGLTNATPAGGNENAFNRFGAGSNTQVRGDTRSFPGIAPRRYEGASFSNQVESPNYTNFRTLKDALRFIADNKANSRAEWDLKTSGDHNEGEGFPFGAKVRKRDGSGWGGQFGQMRSSNMGIPNAAQLLFKKENSQLVENRLVSIVDGELNNSIYGDMIKHIDEIYEAARARGPVVDPTTKKMISSGVDPSVLISFLVSVYAHISNNLLKVYFSPIRMYRIGADEFAPLAHVALWRTQGILPIEMRTDVKDQTFKFKRQLDQYINNDGDINGIGPLKDFISGFKNEYRGDQNVVLDFIDTMRALADEIESAGQNLKASFVDNQGSMLDDPDFQRVSSYVADAVEPSQVILAKNKLLSLKQKSGKEKFFDDFMVGSAQENLFYTLLKPQRSPNADNIDILPVGIPFGFTRGVLGRNPVLDPEGFNNRLVDIIVYKRDLILGDRVQVSQKKFTFDLGMFIGSITDPILSDPNTRTTSIIDPGTNKIILSRGVTERNFPSNLQGVLENNVEFRRVLYGKDEPVIVPFSNAGTIGTSPSGQVFKNHILDHVGRTYIKLTTGIDVSENNIFIDPEFERRNANDSDLASFQALVNARLAQILGREVSFTDYLAGSRATREVLKRLTESERSSPIVSEVRAFLEGNSENQDIISSEDLITFTRMLSPNNSLITPGLTRDKITAPKLFERVFCIFIDPDDFDVIPNMSESDLINSAPGSIYLQGNPGSISHIQIPKDAGLPQATTYNVAIKESREES